jgi:hypothetical protein
MGLRLKDPRDTPFPFCNWIFAYGRAPKTKTKKINASNQKQQNFASQPIRRRRIAHGKDEQERQTRRTEFVADRETAY